MLSLIKLQYIIEKKEFMYRLSPFSINAFPLFMKIVRLLIWIIRRSLVMVAKCLQNLANLVEFGGKEPYMEVVNPFILKNKERMVVFLDQLSVSFFYYLYSFIYL